MNRPRFFLSNFKQGFLKQDQLYFQISTKDVCAGESTGVGLRATVHELTEATQLPMHTVTEAPATQRAASPFPPSGAARHAPHEAMTIDPASDDDAVPVPAARARKTPHPHAQPLRASGKPTGSGSNISGETRRIATCPELQLPHGWSLRVTDTHTASACKLAVNGRRDLQGSVAQSWTFPVCPSNDQRRRNSSSHSLVFLKLRLRGPCAV